MLSRCGLTPEISSAAKRRTNLASFHLHRLFNVEGLV
jgi:hypothetical protein